MDDPYLLTLGFERWVTAFPLQTSMYVHTHAAVDGARLYISVPKPKRGHSATLSPEEREKIEACMEVFFKKHGGKQAKQHVKLLPATA